MKKQQTRAFIRNHIENRGEEKIGDITPLMVMYWWRLLNIAVFDNMLIPPKKIHCRNFRNDNCGWVLIYEKKKEVEIGIRRQLENKRIFLTVLGHEMAHQAQWEIYGDGNHQETFFMWREPLEKRVGLPLNYRIYTT